MALNFSNLDSLTEGEEALRTALPPGTPRAVVEQKMRDAGAELFPQQGGVVAIWHSDTSPVKAKWIISFAFDASGKLERFGANYGLVAP